MRLAPPAAVPRDRCGTVAVPGRAWVPASRSRQSGPVAPTPGEAACDEVHDLTGDALRPMLDLLVGDSGHGPPESREAPPLRAVAAEGGGIAVPVPGVDLDDQARVRPAAVDLHVPD